MFKSVYFIANESRELDASRIYRAQWMADQLGAYGVRCVIDDQDSIDYDKVVLVDVLVLQRCFYSNEIAKAVSIVRKNGGLVLGDVDDLVFLPSYVGAMGGVRSGAVKNIKRTAEYCRARFRSLSLVDYVLASTPMLVEICNNVGFKATLVRNSINTKEHPAKEKDVNGSESLSEILYMAGTKTHKADFELISDQLLRFVGEYRDVQLTFLGAVDVPEAYSSLPNVRVQKKLPMSELYEYIHKHDIVLSPLENTIFNECKSSLKFFESGIVSVPVVASKLGEFSLDIEDGVNGFLCSDHGWYDKMVDIRNGNYDIGMISKKCFEYVTKNYTSQGRGDFLYRTYVELWESNLKTKRSL